MTSIDTINRVIALAGERQNAPMLAGILATSLEEAIKARDAALAQIAEQDAQMAADDAECEGYCPACNGNGDTASGMQCPRCLGTGEWSNYVDDGYDPREWRDE